VRGYPFLAFDLTEGGASPQRLSLSSSFFRRASAPCGSTSLSLAGVLRTTRGQLYTCSTPRGPLCAVG
jgi:hypothetical protein